MMNQTPAKNILIVSTCYIDWGGSEELWARSVPHLGKMGYGVVVYKRYVNRSHPAFVELAGQGTILKDYRSSLGWGARLQNKIRKAAGLVYAELKQRPPAKGGDPAFARNLDRFRPSLVVISQGINFDGLGYAYQCLQQGVPYIIISQKAVDFYWPDPGDREYMTKTLLQARKCLFVSKHNHRLTEEQFGVRLPNGEVVFNPVKLSREAIPYPPTDKGYRLACVARLFLLDKGQDILLRILSEERWRDRPLSVSFIGTGEDEQPLRAMTNLLGLKNVHFTGQVSDMEAVWKDHHALILPSRSEGLALSVAEAMAAGRPVIVTNGGGNAEWVTEGITGFVGTADTETFGEAMERAWNNRDHWESIGRSACAFVARYVPAEPELEFANLLNKVVNE